MNIRDIQGYERREIFERFQEGLFGRGPGVKVDVVRDRNTTWEVRYVVIVEGYVCGWVIRDDEAMPMDRWLGYIHDDALRRGNLISTTRTRQEAVEDVVWNATKA